MAYGRSKTANILFAVEFDRRHRDRGIRATAVHPGGIKTELSRHLSQAELDVQLASIAETQKAAGAPPFSYKTVPQGAATSIWAAVVAEGDAVGGRYCEDCHVAAIQDGEGLRGGIRPYALNPDTAKALWVNSEELVGERF
jgi:NAD(P)-dependent dehydrogenase (short-subunit alcohol dehydrogenase family)